MTKKTPKNPLILSIFGASGDLAKTKIFPTLYQLVLQKELPPEFIILGFARTKKTDGAFRQEVEASVRQKEKTFVNEDALGTLLQHTFYISGLYDDPASFVEYRNRLKEIAPKNADHLAYLSVPPTVFQDIITNLSKSAPKEEKMRVIIEKPFGTSMKTAEELYLFVMQHFAEDQIYLLDHYLGKSSVQSILHLRHANRILNTMIKGREIANIQITAFEDVGIGSRVGYFEQTGIIKDMIQSHLLQTLALITMSIPISESSESLHRERYNILSSVHPPENKDEVVIGQYEGYTKEMGVPKDSSTETFVALRLHIDREAWYNVPIYLRTGKRTGKKSTYVTVELKKFAFQDPSEPPNRVVIEIQPDPKLHLTLVNRLGSHSEEIITSDSIACDIDGCLPDHGNLIRDAIGDDKTYFLSFQEIITTWRVTDAILDLLKKEKIDLESYIDGTAGPKAHLDLPGKDGFRWYELP